MKIGVSAGGVGDDAVGIIVSHSLREAGEDVEFHGRALQFSRIWEPDAQYFEPGSPGMIDLFGDQHDMNEWTKNGHSRPFACCRVAGIEPPKLTLPPIPRGLHPIASRYRIMVFPYASAPERQWNGWRALVDRSGELFDEIVVLGPRSRKHNLRGYPKGTAIAWGQSWRKLCQMMRGSDLVLCNDSGPAHAAGLLGVPTIAVHAAFNESIFRLYPSVSSVMPHGIHCAPCHYLGEDIAAMGCRGNGCMALASLSVETVLGAVYAQQLEAASA